MRHLLSLPVLLFSINLFAQLPPACPSGSPSVSCAEACINCNFDNYAGSTTGFPSGVVPNFCGTVENAQWLGFIAGAVNAIFTITPSNCSNGDGVQVALYQDCMGQPLDCEIGMADGGNKPVNISVPLAPGQNYFLMIDGYAGDQCDFIVSVSPDSAVYQPKLELVGSISGATALCAGSTFEYSVDPVVGAGAYLWTLPAGASIDTSSGTVFSKKNKVNITFGDQSGQICVQAVNSCDANPPCTSSLDVQILPDSEKPVFVTDSVAHLACTDAPIGVDIDIIPLANYTYLWTAAQGSGTVDAANALRPKISEIGLYTLHARNTQNGCQDSVSIRVEEPQLPGLVTLEAKQVSCYGAADGRLRVTDVKNGTAPFLYELGDKNLGDQSEFQKLPPGEHELRILAADGCEWDTTITILQPDELLLDLGPDTAIALGEKASLFKYYQVNDSSRADFLWCNPSALSFAICDTCLIRPLETFWYNVTVRDSNGCTASDDRTVVVTKKFRVYAPNVFAPSAGEGNDFFSLFCGPEVTQVAAFSVFNRWGNLIFDKEKIQPNSQEGFWDGRQNGRYVEPGVFVWQAKVEYISGESEILTGTVTVYR
jgi:PKD-like domain/CHU_C Type IX secretion signal domain